MPIPHVVHPQVFAFNGHKVQVVAFCPLTESQATNAARMACRRHKFPKRVDNKKVYQLLTLFDRHNVNMLGP